VFQQFPQDWTDVGAEAEVLADKPMRVDADGVPLLLVRHEGAIVALADRCTHRGGPLHEGTLADGCIICPWHGSQFRLADGALVRGPATRPAPAAEVRVVSGRVQVRRGDEPRGLRTSPVGH
jgi:nitrite reductase/ring-hydroxylating ferredoxin subunit